MALKNVETSGDVSIKTFDRADEIGIAGATIGRNLSVNSGNASFKTSGSPWILADLVGVTGSSVAGNMAITTGTGNDFVGLGTNVSGPGGFGTVWSLATFFAHPDFGQDIADYNKAR